MLQPTARHPEVLRIRIKYTYGQLVYAALGGPVLVLLALALFMRLTRS